MLLIPKIQQQQPKKRGRRKKLYLVEMKDEHRVFSSRVTLFQPLPLIHIFSRDSLQRTALTRFIFYTYFSAIIRYFFFSIYFIAIAVCLSRFVRSFIVVVFFFNCARQRTHCSEVCCYDKPSFEPTQEQVYLRVSVLCVISGAFREWNYAQ